MSGSFSLWFIFMLLLLIGRSLSDNAAVESTAAIAEEISTTETSTESTSIESTTESTTTMTTVKTTLPTTTTPKKLSTKTLKRTSIRPLPSTSTPNMTTPTVHTARGKWLPPVLSILFLTFGIFGSIWIGTRTRFRDKILKDISEMEKYEEQENSQNFDNQDLEMQPFPLDQPNGKRME